MLLTWKFHVAARLPVTPKADDTGLIRSQIISQTVKGLGF